MKLSPLQLEYYFVVESHVTACRDFKSEEPISVQASDIEVVPNVKPIGEERRWEVTLRVQYTPGPEVNTPYTFSIELVGFFTVKPDWPADHVERLVHTNGPTILFGIARGVVRDITGRGPHPPMILPTASFVPDRTPAPGSSMVSEEAESTTELPTDNFPEIKN